MSNMKTKTTDEQTKQVGFFMPRTRVASQLKDVIHLPGRGILFCKRHYER